MKLKKFYYIIFAVLSTILAVMPACIEKVGAEGEVRIDGADDVISPMQRLVVPDFNQQSSVQVQTDFSASAIQQVKNGNCDIALLGTSPTKSELNGLIDHVIAYDAICVIIDDNSYQGGIFSQGGVPLRKSDGFQNLSLEDLKSIFSYYITPFGFRWTWQYYTWRVPIDLNTESASGNPLWIETPKFVFSSMFFQTGKYDTQTELYQILGINQGQIAKALNNQFSDNNFNSEEEILAIDYPSGTPFKTDSGDFPYKLGFASRRVIPLAMQNVPIDVVSINGVNPLTDTQAIYDGTYPLSREIHVITRSNCSLSTTQFVDYLLSGQGQQALVNAGYLPLQ